MNVVCCAFDGPRDVPARSGQECDGRVECYPDILILAERCEPGRFAVRGKEVVDFLNVLDDHDDVHRVYTAIK